MNKPLTPSFTEEHGLFYLWKAEPQANGVQLSGEFKSEALLQERSQEIFGKKAKRRAA